MKSEKKCPNERCIKWLKNYPHRETTVYLIEGVGHWVQDKIKDAVEYCELCGAGFNGKEWIYLCGSCKKPVKPGELVGLFVPHSCKGCLQKKVEQEKENGKVCGMCRKAYSLCCC